MIFLDIRQKLLILSVTFLTFFSIAQGDRFYKNPGIVDISESEAIGSDHLYNLSEYIGLSIEIIKPPGEKIAISEGEIRDKIIEIFQKGQMHHKGPKISDEEAHPFFHYLIMIVPIEKGFLVYASGRIFENVDVKRVFLEKDTAFQAITWENQHLFFTPIEDMNKETMMAIEKITKQFLERYQYFKTVKN